MELDFKTLYNHAPCGYLYTMEDGTLIDVNDSIHTVYSRKKIIEIRFKTFFPGLKFTTKRILLPCCICMEVNQWFDFIRKDETRFQCLSMQLSKVPMRSAIIFNLLCRHHTA
jgi:hypothetical protein